MKKELYTSFAKNAFPFYIIIIPWLFCISVIIIRFILHCQQNPIILTYAFYFVEYLWKLNWIELNWIELNSSELNWGCKTLSAVLHPILKCTILYICNINNHSFWVYSLSVKPNNFNVCFVFCWILMEIELNRIELNRIESNWIELNWIELNWIESNWIELNWIELNWVCKTLSAAAVLRPILKCIYRWWQYNSSSASTCRSGGRGGKREGCMGWIGGGGGGGGGVKKKDLRGVNILNT